jgi:hypothetical protein
MYCGFLSLSSFSGGIFAESAACAHLPSHTNHHKIFNHRIGDSATGSLADAEAILSRVMKALVAANELRLNMLDLLLVKYYKKKRIWLQVE